MVLFCYTFEWICRLPGSMTAETGQVRQGGDLEKLTPIEERIVGSWVVWQPMVNEYLTCSIFVNDLIILIHILLAQRSDIWNGINGFRLTKMFVNILRNGVRQTGGNVYFICTGSMTNRSSFNWHKLTLIPARMSNRSILTCDEITYPCPNFNGPAIEVWEWISYFIPHFTGSISLIHAGFKVSLY